MKLYSYTILILIAISIILSALALWSETLKVNSIVETGNVDVEFELGSVVEGDEYGKPWVANCTVSLMQIEDEDEDDGNPSGDNDLDLNITIVNGYPGYSCTVYFNVSNVGTIPVIGPFLTMPEVPEGLVVSFEPVLSQLHPGDEAEYSIYIKVQQEATQSTIYTLQIHLQYIQWNEVVVTGGGEISGLEAWIEFRHTNTNFDKCPAYLGDNLTNIEIGLKKGNNVSSVSPGAFFSIIAVKAPNLSGAEINVSYEYQFNIEDGKDEKIRAYIYNETSGCVTELKEGKNFTYTINNIGNTADILITNIRSLTENEVLLIYLKFKPSDELKGQPWNEVDKTFNISATIDSTTTSNSINLILKKVPK